MTKTSFDIKSTLWWGPFTKQTTFRQYKKLQRKCCFPISCPSIVCAILKSRVFIAHFGVIHLSFNLNLLQFICLQRRRITSSSPVEFRHTVFFFVKSLIKIKISNLGISLESLFLVAYFRCTADIAHRLATRWQHTIFDTFLGEFSTRIPKRICTLIYLTIVQRFFYENLN